MAIEGLKVKVGFARELLLNKKTRQRLDLYQYTPATSLDFVVKLDTYYLSAPTLLCLQDGTVLATGSTS